MSSLLFVDLSNQAYKAAAMYGQLREGGVFTGGLFGVLMALCKAIKETNATRVVVCLDMKPYFRKLDFPEYKSGRSPSTEDGEILVMRAEETRKLCLELFQALKVPVWGVEGYECDDLIAFGVNKYRNRFKNVVAMANDSDLYQLFEYENFYLHRGKKGTYTLEDYNAEYGLTRSDFITFFAMTGTHNGVPGIKGIGPVTAMKVIKNKQYLKDIARTNIAVLRRNHMLIELPWPGLEMYSKDLKIQSHEYNERILLKFCARYGINFTVYMRECLELLSR